jgi:hypothetical protein
MSSAVLLWIAVWCGQMAVVAALAGACTPPSASTRERATRTGAQ